MALSGGLDPLNARQITSLEQAQRELLALVPPGFQLEEQRAQRGRAQPLVRERQAQGPVPRGRGLAPAQEQREFPVREQEQAWEPGLQGPRERAWLEPEPVFRAREQPGRVPELGSRGLFQERPGLGPGFPEPSREWPGLVWREPG